MENISVREYISGSFFNNYGLRAVGTVVACGSDVYGLCAGTSVWEDVLSIVCTDDSVFGIRKDGRVYACGIDDADKREVGFWRNIVDIAAGYCITFGLKADGTVVCTSERYREVKQWTEIVCVAAGSLHAVGLKEDGTVVACGNNAYGQCETSGWRNIIAITCGRDYTVGLQSDGTVLFAGHGKNREGKIHGENLFHL